MKRPPPPAPDREPTPLADAVPRDTTRPTWCEPPGENWRPLSDALNGELPPAAPGTPAEPGGYEHAYHQAFEEGLAEAKSVIDDTVSNYVASIGELCGLREEITNESEEALVDLALSIAREVLGSEVEARRDFTIRMADEVLRMLRQADRITLRVGPDDLEAILAQYPTLVSGQSTVRVVEDPSIGLGGLVAECSLGRVDATLERRLAQAAEQLRLSEDDPPPDATLTEDPS